MYVWTQLGSTIFENGPDEFVVPESIPIISDIKFGPCWRAIMYFRIDASFAFICFLTGMLLVCDNAIAQKDDGPVGIFGSRSEYSEFMGGVKQAAYGEGGSPELQAMVPMLNDIALNKPVGWTASEYGTQGSTLGLLADADIRSDLEMVDDQYKQLQELNAEIQKRAAEQIRGLDFSDRKNLVSNINSIRKSAVSDLNGVLLPHQVERLNQIRMQSLLRRKSVVEILTSDPVKTNLEITDEQSADLKTKEKEIEEELQREIAELRERAREKLLASLRPTQKEAVEKMFGDAYNFKEKPREQRKPKGKRKGK